MTNAQCQSVDRIVLCPDASGNEFARVTLLTRDSLVLASAKLDLAALRQAVLCLYDKDDHAAVHIVKCELSEISDAWQTLGGAAAHVVDDVASRTKPELDHSSWPEEIRRRIKSC